jgi:thymidylate synthase (FAD)
MNNTNSVSLLGFYGGDKNHCLSAWQSTNIELGIELPEDIQNRINVLFEETQKGKKKSYGELLKMLADNHHETPFEKSCLHFQIRGDIGSHIHVIKHRIANSINCESARYKELQDKWYIPKDWEGCICDVVYIQDDDLRNYILKYHEYPYYWTDILNTFTDLGHKLYHQATKELTNLLGRSRAKESSRYFLTYNKQLDFDSMFNFRSFIHFQKLRNSEHAQKEIKDIAEEMLSLVKSIPDNPFEYSLKAFGYE